MTVQNNHITFHLLWVGNGRYKCCDKLSPQYELKDAPSPSTLWAHMSCFTLKGTKKQTLCFSHDSVNVSPSNTSRLPGHLNLFPLRIIFCMSERSASDWIDDLDPNHQVIDIGLALPTHCWWCSCGLRTRQAPGSYWASSLISDRWYMGGCL